MHEHFSEVHADKVKPPNFSTESDYRGKSDQGFNHTSRVDKSEVTLNS